MFRRRWSGLPEDPHFPEDLKELGYFVNPQDEIRNIEDDKYYFKYHISKSERVNDRQRFAMNTAVERIIHDRLAALGLTKLRLPQGTTPSDPHVPIFASPNLEHKTRIILLVGESAQDLGVLAHRVVGGPGGIARGSMESVVKLALELALEQPSWVDDDDAAAAPGIVIANPGQLFWWPEGGGDGGGRALSRSMRLDAPMSSAVSHGLLPDPAINELPGHRNAAEHVASVFYDLLASSMRHQDPAARLSIVAVGDGADAVTAFLNVEKNWAAWGGRLDCLASVGGDFTLKEVVVPGLKEFWQKRTRAYIYSSEPAGTPLAGLKGNPNCKMFTDYGCPVFSCGTSWATELMLIEGKEDILGWVQTVAMDENYVNPDICVTHCDKETADGDDEGGAGGWWDYNEASPDDLAAMEEEVDDGAQDGQTEIGNEPKDVAQGNEHHEDGQIGCCGGSAVDIHPRVGANGVKHKTAAADTIELESGNAPHGVTITVTDVDGDLE